MRKYVYVYVYECIHVYMYICIHVHMYICIYVYMYIHIYVCMYIYIHVCIFATSANLPARSHMVDLLVTLALNLSPKTFQNLIQEAPEIYQEGHSKHDASWLAF